MNRSESKYFNTARLMDKAFIELLAKKDIEYITVKEIARRRASTARHSTCTMRQSATFWLRAWKI